MRTEATLELDRRVEQLTRTKRGLGRGQGALVSGAAIIVRPFGSGLVRRAGRMSLAVLIVSSLLPAPPAAGASGGLTAAPAAPAISSPAEGVTLLTFGPTVSWTNPPDATQVEFRLAPAGNDGPGVHVLLGSPVSSFTLPAPPEWYGLLPDMTYTARVRVSNAAGPVSPDDPSWSPWGERRFRTPRIGGHTAGLVSPRNGARVESLTPTIQWSYSNPAAFYTEFQMSKDPRFDTNPGTATAMVYQALIHGGVTNPPHSYTVPGTFPLESDTTYYFRVRPRVQGDGEPLGWSSAWTLRTPGGSPLAFVADEVPPGRADYFRELPAAVAHVCAAASPEHYPTVVIDTDRTLALPETFEMPCRVRFELKQGRRGGLDAAGGSATIQAPEVTLNGMAFPGSVTVIGNSVEITGSRFGGSLTVLVQAPPPARITGASSLTSVQTTTNVARISDTSAGGDIRVTTGNPVSFAEFARTTSGTLSGNVKVTEGGSFSAVTNIADTVTNKLQAEGSVSCNANGNTTATLDLEVTGAQAAVNCAVQGNVSNATTLKAPGGTEVGFTVTEHVNAGGTLTADLAAKSASTRVKTSEVHRFKVDWKPGDNPVKMAIEMDGVSVHGETTIGSDTSTFQATCDFQGRAVVFEGALVATMNCNALIRLAENVRLRAGGTLRAAAGLDLQATRVDVEGGLALEVDQVAGSPVNAKIGMSGQYTFHPAAALPGASPGDPRAEPGAFIGPNLALSLGRRTNSERERSGARALLATGRPLVIENARFLHGPGAGALQPLLHISGVSAAEGVSDVQVRNSTVQSNTPFGIVVSDVDLPAVIENNSVTGGGIYLYGRTEGGGRSGSVAAPYTVRGNTVTDLKPGATGLFVADMFNVEATGNTLTGMPVPSTTPGGIAVQAQSGAYVRLSGGNAITGAVMAGANTWVALSGNRFSGGLVSDPYVRLLNDPGAANQGLDPRMGIASLGDWDGNSCADYPPENNQLPPGACLPGIAPPTAPDLSSPPPAAPAGIPPLPPGMTLPPGMAWPGP